MIEDEHNLRWLEFLRDKMHINAIPGAIKRQAERDINDFYKQNLSDDELHNLIINLENLAINRLQISIDLHEKYNRHNMADPIHPDELPDIDENTIPNVVILSINDLIKEKWTGKSAYFLVQDLQEKIAQRIDDLNFKMDISCEQIQKKYQNIGWIVYFDNRSSSIHKPWLSFRKKLS